MPTHCTHAKVHAHWSRMVKKIRNSEHLEHAVRDVIVDTAKLCEKAEKDRRGHPGRIDFLFIDKTHGLAGWTKEAL